MEDRVKELERKVSRLEYREWFLLVAIVITLFT